jgi:glycosyltransferase involved in cell wall biosynthesis
MAPILLSEDEFQQKIYAFKRLHDRITAEKAPDFSIIIPVRNEEKLLPSFLKSLLEADRTSNNVCTNKEYIFVINNTTDKSEDINQDFIKQNSNSLNAKIIHSAPGVLNAFNAGIESRKLNGFVAKVDADIVLHPHNLALMYMYLIENPATQASYSEPVVELLNKYYSTSLYNDAKNKTKRLYLHGRTSIYRKNPFSIFDFEKIKNAGCIVEDIALSYGFITYYGFDSIQATPHAITYFTPEATKKERESKLIRSKKEIECLEEKFPYFKLITPIIQRR